MVNNDLVQDLFNVINNDNIFFENPDEGNKKTLSLIKQNLSYHYNSNPGYNKLCKGKNVHPEDIKSFKDLVGIPIIPVNVFKNKEKRERLLTIPIVDSILRVESSGTSGVPSISHKDIQTSMFNVATMMKVYKEFLLGIFGGFGMFFILPNKYLPSLGIMKLFGQMQLCLDGFDFLINDPRKGPEIERTLKILKQQEGKLTRHLIGAPYLLLDFMKYIKEEYSAKKLQLDPGSHVIIAGGWKRKEGIDICEQSEFNNMVNDILGIPNERIRDIYAMAESNIFVTECEHKKKHVPPWGYFSARDFQNFHDVEVPYGEEGLLCYYDTCNFAYPGYILSGDVVTVTSPRTKCECGRYGQIVEFKRRANGIDIRSCAVHMDKFMAEIQE